MKLTHLICFFALAQLVLGACDGADAPLAECTMGDLTLTEGESVEDDCNTCECPVSGLTAEANCTKLFCP